jgi:hypothetical protein
MAAIPSQAAMLVIRRAVIILADMEGIRAVADTTIKETKPVNVYPSSC